MLPSSLLSCSWRTLLYSFCVFASFFTHSCAEKKLDYRVTDISFSCPPGWQLFGSDCFQVHSIQRSWRLAMTVCARYGSQLAKISMSDTNEFVGKLAAKALKPIDQDKYWIGLVSHQSSPGSSVFYWSDGSVTSKYAGFWQVKQPDVSQGNCAVASTSESYGSHQNAWSLTVCNQLLPFVCQKPACAKDSFFCHNGRCVSSNSQCDGFDDCGDFSDEVNCPASRGNAGCVKYDKGESGTFQSPNYPSSYSRNANCRWIIEGPMNTRIQLKFDFFETEEHADFLHILDGGPAENASVVIATLSGSQDPSNMTLTSSTNMLIVKFRSDSQIQTRGFQATWRAVNVECGGRLSATPYSQTFTSPNYPNDYPNGLECVWTIDAPRGQLISLDIRDMMLENGLDFLMIYDGPDSASRVLMRHTGISMEPQTVVSNQNQLYVYFLTNVATGAKGFTINYKMGCDNVIEENHGTILSPGNLMVPYPNAQECSYTLQTSEGSDKQPITVVINRFDVLQDDYFMVYDGADSNGKALHGGMGFGGLMRPPSTLVSESGKMHVVFSTNPIRNAAGWNITFSKNCPMLNVPKAVSLSTELTAFGTEVTVACPPGFEFISGQGNQFKVMCLLGGKWSQSAVPKCQPIYCAPVPQIANGFAISASNVTFGGVADYECYQGFSFASGRSTDQIYCTEEGKWTPAPVCKAQTCPALPPFQFGERMLEYGDGTGYGTVYRYQCQPGFYRVGSPALLCETTGQWSANQPRCHRLRCFDLPKIENGEIMNPEREFVFEDTTKVLCYPGFKTNGTDMMMCGGNQTFSESPQCIDVDECMEGSAACIPRSTTCVNLPGGYKCDCQQGFEPQLACTIANPLGLSTGVIRKDRIEVTSQHPDFASSFVGSSGWCAANADLPQEMSVFLEEPTIIERIRLGKVGPNRELYVTAFSLMFSSDWSQPPKPYVNENGEKILLRGNTDNGLGSEVVILPEIIEAKVVVVVVEAFEGGPCMKLELFGCRKTNCNDIDECSMNNGACDQVCTNTPGGYRCSCKDGYDLFVENNQGGVQLAYAEDGAKNMDVVRFNKTCIPKMCPELVVPENGKILSPILEAKYPMVFEIQCIFGYQMYGPSHLQCKDDGTWNGTVPRCVPALCPGLTNQSSIGLFVAPDNSTIGYNQNVSIHCTQETRPGRSSPFTSFRQCVYDPQPDGRLYWLSGYAPDCPQVDCGPPLILAGANYDGLDLQNSLSYKVGNQFGFSCRPPYSLMGNSTAGDQTVRCQVDGTWDFGDLRCEGPVCVDPGYPSDGDVTLDSVEEGSVAEFSCKRPGFELYPSKAIQCVLGAPCIYSEDVGINTGFIPDGAFGDNSDSALKGYEPHRGRMISTGWCGHTDSFIFLTVDLQRVFTLTTLRLAGVGSTGHLRGHATKLQLFFKQQFSHNYDTYPVEFQTPRGNHNKMHVFNLNPAVRARYLLLGVSEYDENPCVRFDFSGCLAPLTPSQDVDNTLQVGWNSSVPTCVDVEKPVFTNCPEDTIFVETDDKGQLTSADYPVPMATDNSGSIAWTKVEPENFVPPRFITRDTEVIYTAYDSSGNSAVCKVMLKIPDTQPPKMKCPDSYVVNSPEELSEMQLTFDETTVNLVVDDVSNISKISFTPSVATVKVGEHVTVVVKAHDQLGNVNKCKFQVAVRPTPCTFWSLSEPVNGQKQCQNGPGGGLACKVDCLPGFQFMDAENVNDIFTCEPGQQWAPSPVVPACIPVVQEPARYELTVTIVYPVRTPVGQECLQGYSDLVQTYFDELDAQLSQRCSQSVQTFVRFLDVKFASHLTNVTANYTVQILPSVQQDVFYNLCGLTLKTIFDLRYPGSSRPVTALLALPGEAVATQGNGCPTINASETLLSQGFGCDSGEVLTGELDNPVILPQCLPCPSGTFFMENACMPCPQGTYQNEMGQVMCKECAENTYTEHTGAKDMFSCLPVCGNGMSSPTGMIPCDLCPRHTHSGPPPIGGFTACEPCPDNTFTANVGATGPSQCMEPCAPGTFSVTGLKPCSPCPINFVQPNFGQQRCTECPVDTYTEKSGSASAEGCVEINCDNIECENGGTCDVRDHAVQCQCRPGFNGVLCEEDVDSCLSQPCHNNGQCIDELEGYSCICPEGYNGNMCQFGPEECIDVECPNGGVCQDLPGIGTTKCLCRTGFTGPSCSELVNMCTGESNPCEHGSGCQPLSLGRYKCFCLPGWTGPNCDVNIDDCAEKPCTMGANCTDMVNDFQCDCPPGFTGKRCHIKQELCAQDPCIHGLCVDRLFSLQCKCEPGWSGEFCETNINECASEPCINGATCRDDIDGLTCQCQPGYYGSRCQHPVDHCGSSPCRNNATCENQGAVYKCHCKLGYEGAYCEHNINECQTLGLCAPGTQTCMDKVNEFECLCRPGFTGLYCDIEIDECLSSPCLNNGTCVDGIAEFSCHCPIGWTGQRCDIDEGGCENGPCQNDGKCVNLVDDYFCVCPSGVDGKNCEIAPNRCIGEPCHNGGVCGDYGSRLECTCPLDYVGVGCQYELDACNADLCQNGATCMDFKSGYKCSCAAGFTGKNCETNIDDCSPSPCPLTATCIDQINSHYCQCPFNMTGNNCDKVLTPQYDIRFYDPILPSQAGLSVPFKLQAKALSVSMWVRFEKDNSRGTLFTLYQSSELNYPSKVKELMRVSSEGIRVEMFPGETPLSLTFPANQRINDGQWNHISFVWESTDGSYSLIWNAVRIFGDSGYATGKEIDINAWITLGYPMSETPNEPKFVGSVSRVNLWSRALSFTMEIPKMVESCQNAEVIHDSLVLRWTGYNRLSGKVEKVVPSICGGLLCPATVDSSTCTAEKSMFMDKTPPTAQFCPGDLYVVTPLKEVNVTWIEPVFSDNVALESIEHNLKSGQLFTWGDYSVLYGAYDNSTNAATCSFNLHVAPEFCPDLKDPINGIQTCESWGPDLRFKSCSISCETGMQFSQKVAEFYSCGIDGQWRPRPEGSFQFKYPQCSKMKPATRMVKFHLSYPTSVICNDAGQRTLAEKLRERLTKLQSKWKICAYADESGNCKKLDVAVNCQQNRRVKRQASDIYTASILFPANKDPLSAVESNDVATVLEILQNDVLLNNGFNFENTLPNGRPDLNSFQVTDVYTCPLGQVPIGSSCVPCAPGSLTSAQHPEQCSLCPVGQYQPRFGQTNCLPCSPGYTTTGPGATGLIDCKESCLAGKYMNLDTERCEECGYGFYQARPGSFNCFACGVGKTTLTRTSTNEDECRDECPDGHHLIQAGQCEECPQGKYRTKGVHKTCINCPQGITTEGTGAIGKQGCNTPRCEAGFFLVVSAKQCQQCPRGSYQSQSLQSACKPCDTDHTTPGSGATHETQCYSTNQCDTGEHNCSWHAICIDKPDENFGDTPAFECKCKPGFRGNGTHCEDACIDHCLNDGICKKNPVGYVECDCKQHFTGERCEIRFQPKTQKVAHIAGAIGGAVAILIIIVIVIWMICFRFNKRSSSMSESNEKLPGDNMQGELGDPNFMYGRPQNQDQKALGYYYEDEDEYDMKTMYINDAYEATNSPAVQEPASVNGSIANKDEVYERLRRINNHMYRPKQENDAKSNDGDDRSTH